MSNTIKSIKSDHYAILAGSGAGKGTFIIERLCDRATTLRFVCSEGQADFNKLASLHSVRCNRAFDAACREYEYTEPLNEWFTTSSGRIEIAIAFDDADGAAQSGQNDAAINELSRVSYISTQLNEINAELLKEELAEYGCWDDDELADHDQNLQRILWLACWDIKEERASA